MKKFTKFCLIAALILILIGFIMGIAGSVAGGGYDVLRMIENGELTFDSSFFGIHFGDGSFDREEREPLYDLDDIEDFTGEEISGDIEKRKLTDEIITKLDITLGGGELYLIDSEDGAFYLEAEKAESLQAYVEDDTLKLKALRTKGHFVNKYDMKVYLYIPAGLSFEEVDIDLGAGVTDLSQLANVDELHVTVGAGKLTMNGVMCTELEATVGAGELIAKDIAVTNKAEFQVDAGHIGASGEILGDVDVECALGAVELVLKDEEEAFNYEIECAAGNVQIGNRAFTAVAADKRIQNDAIKDMKLECSLGSIEIYFER